MLLVILLLNRLAHSMGIRDETKISFNLNPDIEEKITDESLADLLLESVVYIGLVQAKVNTALKNYRPDIQKNMLKELKKIATEVYKELDSSSSSDSSDSNDEDSDDEDVIQWDDIVQATRSPLFQQDGEDEESSRFSRFKQDEDEEDDSDDEDSDDEEEEEEEEEDDRSGVVTERRGKFFYTDYYDEQI